MEEKEGGGGGGGGGGGESCRNMGVFRGVQTQPPETFCL